MKKVIIRLDYGGVLDGSKLAKIFAKTFPSDFREREEVHNDKYSIDLRADELKEISESLSIPVSVIERGITYRYKNLRGSACKVTMSVSQYYLCMTIICEENYDGLNNYIKYFKGAISAFAKEESYFQPKRLGLRKIRVECRKSISDFNDVFENTVFREPDYSISATTKLKSEYFDFIECSDKDNICFNIRRILERLKDNNNVSPQFVYQSTLDIDAYYTFDETNMTSKINSLLEQANDLEFDVYKACMRESYLKSISK
jgi:uncharacterized protein (TIGR04255 family)